jgi:hypothetical protein
MNRILHVAMKDLKHLYPGLAGCYGLIVIPCLLFTLAASGVAPSLLDPLAAKSYSMVCFWLYAILSSFVLARLIQSDPVVGTTAFWLTRPISPSTLLAAKVLFTGLLLVLVPAAIEVAGLLANGLSLEDLQRHLPGILFRWLLLTLPLLALASLSSDYGRFALLLLVSFASWILIWLFGELYLWGHSYTPYSVRMPRRIVWIVLTLLLSLAILAHQFLTRKLIRSLLLGLAGLLATTVCANLWNKPAGPIYLPSVLDPGFANLKASITFTPVRDLGLSGSAQKSLMLAMSDPRSGIEITGVPPGYVARPLSIRRPSPAAPTRESLFDFPRSEGAWVRNRTKEGSSALGSVLGATTVLNAPILDNPTLMNYRFMRLLSPDMFEVSLEQGLGEQLGARKEIGNTEVVLLVSRLETGAVIPARQGAFGSDKEFTKVLLLETVYRSDSVSVYMQECSRKVSLTSLDWTGGYVWVLRNSKRKEVIVGRGEDLTSFLDHGWSMFSPLAQTLSIRRLRVHFQLPSATVTLDREWLQDAELVRVRSTPAGYLAKPIVIQTAAS